MKRRRIVIKMIALLVAGAVINVAVAWGLAYWKSSDGRSLTLLKDQTNRELLLRYFPSWSDEGVSLLQGSDWSGLGVHRTNALVVLGQDRVYMALEEESGFPCLSFSGARTATESSGSTLHGWPLGDLFADRTPGLSGTFVPYSPLWPGFAVNTLFYAGVLWVMFFAPFALRRMIRRRRGRCPACAYPIGQSPVCTECGHSVMPAKAGIQSRAGSV